MSYNLGPDNAKKLSFVQQNYDTLGPLITKWSSTDDEEEELSELATKSESEKKVLLNFSWTVSQEEKFWVIKLSNSTIFFNASESETNSKK